MGRVVLVVLVVVGGMGTYRGGLASVPYEVPTAAAPTTNSSAPTDHVAVFSFGFADCVDTRLLGPKPMASVFPSL